MSELDTIDRRILELLQQDGRLTMTELGERVGLSTSPCSQRVKRLEAQGVITGYHARVNPTALGKSLLGRFEGDEVEILVAGARQLFTVTEAK